MTIIMQLNLTASCEETMFPTLSEGTLIDVMQCRLTTPRSFASASEHCLMTIKRYETFPAAFAYICLRIVCGRLFAWFCELQRACIPCTRYGYSLTRSTAPFTATCTLGVSLSTVHVTLLNALLLEPERLINVTLRKWYLALFCCRSHSPNNSYPSKCSSELNPNPTSICTHTIHLFQLLCCLISLKYRCHIE